MPYTRELDALGTNVVLDSGDYAGLLDRALARFGRSALHASLAARPRGGGARRPGLAFFVEKSGLGASDGVRITVEAHRNRRDCQRRGLVGQGVETVLAQICAEVLCVDYSAIRVVRGRTDRIEFGNGAHASRVTVMSGSATWQAALAVRDMALETAAQLLQAARKSFVWAPAAWCGRARGRDGTDMAEVARHMGPNSPLMRGRTPGLTAERWFYNDHMTYPYGAHLALVRLDPATGETRVERYLVAYDVGRAINPMLVEGQIAGGSAQGLGGALSRSSL